MIQRKQSVFLFLAFVITLVCLCLPIAELQPITMGGNIKIYNLFIANNGSADYSVCGMFGTLVISSLLSLATIFLYRNRKLQANFCVCNIFLLIAWYIVLGASLRTVATSMTFHINFAAILPAVAAILVFMARAGVIHDEKLVRAADRIR